MYSENWDEQSKKHVNDENVSFWYKSRRAPRTTRYLIKCAITTKTFQAAFRARPHPSRAIIFITFRVFRVRGESAFKLLRARGNLRETKISPPRTTRNVRRMRSWKWFLEVCSQGHSNDVCIALQEWHTLTHTQSRCNSVLVVHRIHSLSYWAASVTLPPKFGRIVVI